MTHTRSIAAADIFGLGATLFYADRTGAVCRCDVRGEYTAVGARVRPEIPAGLDAIISRMMATDPNQRYATAETTMRAMLPFLPQLSPPAALPPVQITTPPSVDPSQRKARLTESGSPLTIDTAPSRVLIVDDQPDIRRLCRIALSAEGLLCDEAEDGPAAVALVGTKPYDLVLLDVDLPGFSGEEVLRRLRWPVVAAFESHHVFEARPAATTFRASCSPEPMISSPNRSVWFNLRAGEDRTAAQRRPRPLRHSQPATAHRQHGTRAHTGSP